jgi:inosine-uridine nucleoside N-ribohydrolase
MPPQAALRLDTSDDQEAREDLPQSPTGEFIWNLLNHVRVRSMSLLGLRPKIPAGLCDAEMEIYQTLLGALKSRAMRGQKPPHLVVITDLAKDYDDLLAMVLLAELHRLGLVELEAFVANLMPAQKRARFGRGALDLLGLKQIPIAAGSIGSVKQHKVNDYEFKHCSFMAPPDCAEFENGEDLLFRVFRKAEEEKRKITLVLLSSLMDISEFAHKYPNLLKSAVDRISIQGGMYFDKGTLKADSFAANNNFALDHAMHFTKYIQDNNIPTTVFTKVAAFATKIYSEFFADLAATGHPIGIHLRKTQLAQDVNFYTDTMDEKTRFRPFMTQRWFLTNKSTWFTEGHSEDPTVEPYPPPEQVVPYLTVVVAYDALAALGAVGEDVLADLCVLKPAPDSSIYRIVGVGPSPNTPDIVEDPGVFGEQMALAIKALVKGSLLASQQQRT